MRGRGGGGGEGGGVSTPPCGQRLDNGGGTEHHLMLNDGQRLFCQTKHTFANTEDTHTHGYKRDSVRVM